MINADRTMPPVSSNSRILSIFGFLPWLHFLGAICVFVIIALFTAVHSELGRAISAGESPIFDWIRDHMGILLGFCLAYLTIVFLLQLFWMRSTQSPLWKAIGILVAVEVITIPILATGLIYTQPVVISLAHIVLLISILVQGTLAMQYDVDYKTESGLQLFGKIESRTGLFLFLLFMVGGLLAFFDPSWHRMQGYVRLDTTADYFLSRLLPPALSGSIVMWFGIFVLSIMAGSRALQNRLIGKFSSGIIAVYGAFFLLSCFLAAMLLGTTFHAIYWEISTFGLKSAMIALFVLLWIVGGVLITRTYMSIVTLVPHVGRKSPAAIAAVSMGAIFLLPLVKSATLHRGDRWTWRVLLIIILFVNVGLGYFVLNGDIFNPWFTAFSYLKGAILKTIAVIVGGALVLIVEELPAFETAPRSKVIRPWMIIVIAFLIGFLPFGFLARTMEVKAGVLQFNELSRVDTAYARELVNFMGLNRWISIGQNPDLNSNPHPWPLPWNLKKTHRSMLPANFNLLVIVVDALRGDAFHSAGYHRNLTPFMDRWASDDAISFRRAYSQGGGSFAAFPFLVAGRSRFSLYGPNLYHKNLYFKIARAEGIQAYMVMKGFGSRSIFPPDFPVMELAIPRPVGDRRTAAADEVFDSARTAIGGLPEDERFLCVLHLMDVHNDLWKKEGGIDFGDGPRDLYDNNLAYIDRAFSRFVDWLKQQGIYDQTVILFTSDHGEQFWEHGASLHGHTLYEEEIRVPLILLAHGIKGRFEHVPVIVADMAPTIADLAGYTVEPPYDDPHMGISLVSLILKGQQEPYLKRDVVGRASFKRRYFLYRNWEWKLVYFAELDLMQLFNVVRDPAEKINLLEEEPELAAELERELFDYLAKVEGKSYRSLLSNRKHRE
jgi:hypothetical protein